MSDFLVSLLPQLGSFASIVAMAGVAYLLKLSNTIEKNINSLKNNDKEILKSLIKDLHKDYKQKGYVTTYDLEVVLGLTERYESLGGDSFIHEMVEEIKHLPLVDTGKVNQLFSNKERKEQIC